MAIQQHQFLFAGPAAGEAASRKSAGTCQPPALRGNGGVLLGASHLIQYQLYTRRQLTALQRALLLGGCVGGTGGYLLAWYTQTAYPLVTGGMPIVAKWPTGIITYELTMLGAIISTLITLLITTRLPNWGEPALGEPEVSNGKIVIGVIDPSASSREEIESRLVTAGAEAIKSSGHLAR